MAVKSEQIEKNLVKLTFEISREELEKGIKYAYQQNAKKISVPGFRKGKVPKSVIEKYYGEEVFYDDAINHVLPDLYEAALKEAELESVARPEIDIEEIKKGEPIVVNALVTTKPEVKLGKYKGIKADKVEYNVTEEDIDKDIDLARARNARIITVEDRAIENGDIAVIDFEGFYDGVAFPGGKGENYELEIGSGSFIPGFEEQLIGKEKDADVEVNVTFPEEYHAEDLAGKDAMFKVKIHEIKAKELPELDDDFASEVSEFETLEEYKNSVKERLEKAAEERAKREMENQIVEKVVESSQIDIPAAMIETQIDRLVNDFAQRLSYQGMSVDMYLKYTGSTMDAFREGFKEQAEKQVRTTLVMEEIAKAEGIEANQEEIDEKIAEMGKMYNMENDKLKELLRPEDIEDIAKEITFVKAIEMLVNKASVK